MNAVVKQYEKEIRSQIYTDLQKGIAVSVLVENNDHCLSFSMSESFFGGYKTDEVELFIGEDEVEDNGTLSEIEQDLLVMIEEGYSEIIL